MRFKNKWSNFYEFPFILEAFHTESEKILVLLDLKLYMEFIGKECLSLRSQTRVPDFLANI